MHFLSLLLFSLYFPLRFAHLLSRGVASNWRFTPVSSRPPLMWASPSGRIQFVGGRTCGDGILYWRLVLEFEWKCGSHCLNWRDWSEMGFRGWGGDEVDLDLFIPPISTALPFVPPPQMYFKHWAWELVFLNLYLFSSFVSLCSLSLSHSVSFSLRMSVSEHVCVCWRIKGPLCPWTDVVHEEVGHSQWVRYPYSEPGPCRPETLLHMRECVGVCI